MTYTIIRREPHTSAVFRSVQEYKQKSDGVFTMGVLNVISPFDFIRYIQRY